MRKRLILASCRQTAKTTDGSDPAPFLACPHQRPPWLFSAVGRQDRSGYRCCLQLWLHPRTPRLPQRCQLPSWLSEDANGTSGTTKRSTINIQQAQDWKGRMNHIPPAANVVPAPQLVISKRPKSAHLLRHRVKASRASCLQRWRVQQKRTLSSFPVLAFL